MKTARYQSLLLVVMLLLGTAWSAPVRAQELVGPAKALGQPEADPEAPSPGSEAAQSNPEPPIVGQKAATTSYQNSICLMIESAALDHGLPVDFFARVIWRESRFKADAVGPITRSGERAQGIAQFMPGTAAERRLLDPLDPVQALPKSAEFLQQLRIQFGNLGLAAAKPTMPGPGACKNGWRELGPCHRKRATTS